MTFHSKRSVYLFLTIFLIFLPVGSAAEDIFLETIWDQQLDLRCACICRYEEDDGVDWERFLNNPSTGGELFFPGDHRNDCEYFNGKRAFGVQPSSGDRRWPCRLRECKWRVIPVS